MDVEGDVLHHDEAVSHGNTSEDEVDGVVPHVPVCEHHHVHHVEGCSQDADNQGQVAMQGQVGSLQIVWGGAGQPCVVGGGGGGGGDLVLAQGQVESGEVNIGQHGQVRGAD